MPFSHLVYASYTSLSNVHIAPIRAESQRTMTSILSRLKLKKPAPPAEVIQAACDLYGIAPDHVASIRAEELSALSPYLWVITLNERTSAVVVYEPGAGEQPVAAPWFEEMERNS